MAEHVYKTPQTCNCGHPYCAICEGGLAVCAVCGLAEGSLTSECPGEPSPVRGNAVYAGLQDYRNGRWVAGMSCHCPPFLVASAAFEKVFEQ